MTTFDEREAAFENKFAHDEKMQFIARMRRNRFMAVWASTLKGEPVEKARDYGQELVRADLQNVSEDDVVEAVKGYLGDLADEAKIREKMAELLVEAKEQVMSEAEI
ncbi:MULTISPECIES: DUF1476 domain-containing protein [unclassified Ruegeria]|uniref:DUF1476 domain-containing protein n=1 Tax=unclassified Ruegeria TaxID=2625375 RepID=UPI001489A5D8|nr:DUF1476 domain-containing protein [Ruegeria sp. HKCCD8929]